MLTHVSLISRTTKYNEVVRHQIESEDESRLMWAGNGATQYRVVNMDKPNKWGEYPGYRILPSQGAIHLAATNSTNLLNSANFAYHDLQVRPCDRPR